MFTLLDYKIIDQIKYKASVFRHSTSIERVTFFLKGYAKRRQNIFMNKINTYIYLLYYYFLCFVMFFSLTLEIFIGIFLIIINLIVLFKK